MKYKKYKSAIIRPRIHSSKKQPLENLLLLNTPFSAHIDICSLCNFRCSYCFHADEKALRRYNVKLGKMPEKLFKKIVDNLTKFKQKLKKVKIGNHGEPTLHKNLPDFIQYISNSNITDIIELFTNGSMLTPSLSESIISAGLNRINISIQGLSSERYKEVTGVTIDFKKLVKNIQYLYKIRGNCKIYIKIVDKVYPLAENETPYILQENERKFFYDLFGPICDEIYIEKVVPQWAETQLKKQNTIEETGMYGQKVKQYKEICPFIFMYLHFNWDGTVSPCTLDWPKKIIIGNVYRESPKDIWEGKKLRDLRIAMAKGDRKNINFCNNCSAPVVCVDEDLDPFKDKVYEALNVSDTEKIGPNPWIMNK